MKKQFNTKITYLLTLYNAVFLNSIDSMHFQSIEKKKPIIFAAYLGNYASRFPKFFKVLWFLLLVVFPLLFIVYNLFFLFKSVICCWRTKKEQVEGNVFFMSGACIFLKRPDIAKNLNIYKYILLPFKKAPQQLSIETSNKIYTVFNLLSVKDIFVSFKNTVWCFFPVIKRFGYAYSVYMLNAFQWFLCAEALKKLPKVTSIYICNQKDRWATLVDKLSLAQINVIQHGTNYCMATPDDSFLQFYKYDSKYGYWYHNMPQKMSNTSKLYAYSEKEADAIIKGEYKCTPLVELIGYGLTLTDIEPRGFQVLIVGCSSVFSQNEEKIIKNLQNSGVNIFVKPHPVDNGHFYKYLQQKYSYTLVYGNCFPNVDVVISYDSTLAHQYDSLGVKVLLYDGIDIDNIKEVILQYKYEMGQRVKLK